MSLDLRLTSTVSNTVECTCSCCGHTHTKEEFEVYFDYNITHNLNKMAEAAGIYNHLWHPQKIGICYARDLIEPLKSGLKKLKDNPAYYRKYEPENGYGKYENLVKCVELYLQACIDHPDAW
jgi:hypothetical protein